MGQPQQPQGMVVAQVVDLGHQFATGADQLDGIAKLIAARVHAVTWHGVDADRFRADLIGHLPALTHSAQLLRGLSQRALDNAHEQQRTSQADGGGGIGGLAFGLSAAVTLAASLAAAGAATQAPDDEADGYHIGPPTKPPLSFDNDFPYDPNAHASAGDHLSWAEWGAKLTASELIRHDLADANAAYQHYRDNTGTDLHVDYDKAYQDDSAIRAAVDNQIASAEQAAEHFYATTGQGSFQITGDAVSQVTTGGYPTTEDWQKTLGSYSLYGTADVTVTGNQVSMHIVVHAEDMYNFNKDMHDIASGAPDNDNGRFATLGWAKEFRAYGELERTVTWTLGDPASAQVTSPDTDNGRR